jgi:hypothetical protein
VQTGYAFKLAKVLLAEKKLRRTHTSKPLWSDRRQKVFATRKFVPAIAAPA